MNISVEKAVEVLREGGLVVVPTETVYGLAANGLNEEAVKNIFVKKGRPSQNPLILHVDSLEMLELLVDEVNDEQKKLIDKFWPGPLTLLFKKKSIVPDIVTAGLDTVCVRMPAQKDVLKIINKLGSPLAAPSANRSGRPSPTRLEDVYKEMPDLPVVDGGDLEFGIESTIVNISKEKFQLLRKGSLKIDLIENLLGRKHDNNVQETIISPGMGFRHYSPDGDLILIWPWEIRGKTSNVGGSDYSSVEEAVADLYLNYKTGIICVENRADLYLGYDLLTLGNDEIAQSQKLYSLLFETEKLGWEKIVIDMCGIDSSVIAEKLVKAASKK